MSGGARFPPVPESGVADQWWGQGPSGVYGKPVISVYLEMSG